MKINLNISKSQTVPNLKSIPQSSLKITNTELLPLIEQENVLNSNLSNQESPSISLADKLSQPITSAPIAKPNSLQGLINGDLEKQNTAIAISDKETLGGDSMSLSSKLSTSIVCDSPAPQVSSVNNIPQITNEKYKLLAEATDTLAQSTIDQFEERMQAVVNAFGNTGLHDAMKRVLEYTQEHNELRTFLRAEDIQIFVRGARQSYAAVAKTKTANRSKKSNSKVIDSEVASFLEDLEIEL